MAVVLAKTGCRLTETLEIKMDYLMLDEGFVRLRKRKDGKQTVVPIDKETITTEGEPVFPRYLFGNDDLPEGVPEIEPTTGVNVIRNNFRVVLESEFREEQERLFNAVEQFLETHGS